MTITHPVNVLRRFVREHAGAISLWICGVAFLGHFYASDFKGIWTDEAHRLAIANGGSFKSDLFHRHPGTPAAVLKASKGYSHQPLYYLLLNAILRFTRSYSTTLLYLTNTFLFVLSAVALFEIARTLVPPRGQLFALLLYAFSGHAMAFALQIREYCLILFLLTWNIFFFLRLIRRGISANRVSFAALALGHIVTATLGFYASLWTVFFFAPQAVLAFWQARRGSKRPLIIPASHLIAGLAVLPWLLHDWRAKLTTAIYDKTPPTMSYLASRASNGFEFVLTGNYVHRWAPQIFHLIFILSGTVVAAYVVLLLIRFGKISVAWRYIVLCICSFLGFQITYFFFKEPLSVNPRYFILYLPFTTLVLAGAFVQLERSFRHRKLFDGLYEVGGIIVAFLIGALQIGQYYHDPDVDHRDDFRAIYTYLDARAGREADVVVDERLNLLALQFYSNRPDRLLPLSNYKVAATSAKEIWMVTNRPEPQIRAQVLALQRRLNEIGYQLQEEKKIELTQLRKYSLPNDVRQSDLSRRPASR